MSCVSVHTCLYMPMAAYICVCLCIHVCTCVCVCVHKSMSFSGVGSPEVDPE